MQTYCVLPLYIITSIIILLCILDLSNQIFGDSPSFTRRQFTDRYDDLINMTSGTYFNSSKTKNPLMDLTDMLSVNYFSDGKKLHSIFWLASPFTPADNTADTMSYGILIDADFDNTTGIQGADYSISINWNRSSNTWYKSFEELESANEFFNVGDRRILNLTSNTIGSFSNDHRFMTLDVDLSRILFPEKYRIIFFTQYRDRSFWVVDFTDWISIPLPQLTISSFPNPVFLTRGGQTSVELRLSISAGYESVVHLYTDNRNGDVSVKFIPENITVPSYGMSTSRLIVRVSDIAEVGQQITLPILARLIIPSQSVTKINSTDLTKIGTVCSHPGASSLCLPSSITSQGFIEKSSLTIRVMTFEEQLSNFVSRLFNPITTIITTIITIVSGILGYVYAKSRNK